MNVEDFEEYIKMCEEDFISHWNNLFKNTMKVDEEIKDKFISCCESKYFEECVSKNRLWRDWLNK